MFCLLAVLLYIIVAQEECLDYHQVLSQRTLLHSREEDGLFFFSNVTLMESQDGGFRISLGVISPTCFEHFHVVCHVRCQ